MASAVAAIANTYCYYEIISRPYIKTTLKLKTSRDSHITLTDRNARLAAKSYTKFN
jgi:hypothetical protein